MPWRYVEQTLPFVLPGWYKDAFALSILLLLAAHRTNKLEADIIARVTERFKKETGAHVPVGLVWFLKGIGVIVGLLWLSVIFSTFIRRPILHIRNLRYRSTMLATRPELLSNIEYINQNPEVDISEDVAREQREALVKVDEGLNAAGEVIVDNNALAFSLLCAVLAAIAFFAMNAYSQ